MRAAPQVLYPLGRSRYLTALLTLLGLLTLSFMVAVAASQPHHHLVAVMGLLWVVAVGLSVRATPPAGAQLWWDGERWHLLGPRPTSGQLILVLDAQRALLLRWASPPSGADPAASWLWIEQDADPVIWKDVRRAIYWHAR